MRALIILCGAAATVGLFFVFLVAVPFKNQIGPVELLLFAVVFAAVGTVATRRQLRRQAVARR
ncbi:MAG: hypothetical protein PGN07_02905 [Aeromicrobium erythreum]